MSFGDRDGWPNCESIFVRSSVGRRFALTAALALCAACPAPPSPPTPRGWTAAPWPEADAPFHADPRWQGADAAYSIPLGGDRSLWLFQDTLAKTSNEPGRAHTRLVRNSIAIEAGADPTRASMRFFTRTSADGEPASFFADEGARWTWPLHGVRTKHGPLVVFLQTMHKSGNASASFDFEPAAVRAAIVDDPSADPRAWSPRFVELPSLPFDAVVGGAVIEDGAFVVALATRFHGAHAGYLARMPTAALLEGRAELALWTGAAWTPLADLRGAPAVVLDDAGPECSIHFDARTHRWVHIASVGFGATSIAARFAEAITGPWSAPRVVFKPQESSLPHVLVYAAKAHPELEANGALAVTYVANPEDFSSLFKPEGAALYWPRFLRIDVGDAR
jgi:hypothetical protein